ncbi:hypothetical protein F2P44_11615 [Massilia sp. CCM 8695]|uniref:DJ-1/PfpI domain-containing protein n=1 Tax=Massilia frigida TaxID=2609281 RepID=A0ABX0N687_9BURK|nr:hypothetical protein [Massilia frigida]NHZ79918.1 hypothetical protein [Massilia frigida]
MVIKENDASTRDGEERFSNDMMLIPGGRSRLMADPVDVLAAKQLPDPDAGRTGARARKRRAPVVCAGRASACRYASGWLVTR